MGDTSQNIGEEGSSAEKPVLVSARYEKVSHVCSTRTSEGFEALDKSNSEKVFLWVLRYPLQYPSEEASRFVRRLKELSKLAAPTLRFRSFGVDPTGTAYLVTDWVQFRTVMDASQSLSVQERTFSEMLACLAKVHEAGICMGDICEDTFVLSPDNKILLVGLLGSFDLGARQTANLPSGATLHYLSPEQRMGGVADMSCDVFAMGIYGYRYFAGRYPAGDKADGRSADNPMATAPAPTFVRSELQRWTDDIFGRCLEVKAQQRFADISEMHKAVEEAMRTGVSPGGTSAWSRRTVIVRPGPAAVDDGGAQEARTAARRRARGERRGDSESPAGNRFKAAAWLGSIALGALIATIIYKSLSSDSEPVSVTDPDSGAVSDPLSDPQADPQSDPQRDPQAGTVASSGGPLAGRLGKEGATGGAQAPNTDVRTEYAPSELKPLIAELQSPETPQEKRVQALARISEYDDSSARAALYQTLKSDREVLLRRAAQRLLIEKVRNSGRPRTAGVLEAWVRDLLEAKRDPTQIPAFVQLLDSAMAALPVEARQNALQEAYASESKTALRLAATLSLEEAEPHFVPVLHRFLSAELNEAEVAGKGVGALILSHPALSTLIDADFGQTLEKFSDADLQWALGRLAAQPAAKGSAFIIDLANESLKRKLLEPLRAVFLQALVDNGEQTPYPIQQALLRSAVGEPTADDVNEFGRWMSMSGERVLLAVAATAKTQTVSTDAFDVLAGRGLNTEPASSLIAWIKAKFWDYRKGAVKAVGILGLSEIASPEEINTAFEALMPFAGGGLFRVMSNTTNVYLVKESIDRMGALASSAELLPLLRHSDKPIRMAAVKALKDRNELAVLQGILRAFEKEKDEDVRAVYREHHWVTRDRSGPARSLPQ